MHLFGPENTDNCKA